MIGLNSTTVKDALERLAHRKTYRLAAEFETKASGLPGAEAYQGLTPLSLSVASAHFKSAGSPLLNLVLPELSSDGLFAGVRTAIEVALLVSQRLNRQLRVVAFAGVDDKRSGEALLLNILRDLKSTYSFPVEFIPVSSLSQSEFHDNDYWLVTHWTTAHAVDVASKLGLLDPCRVMYLIQDYEPGFLPWSTEYMLAKSTYHAGFIPLVNSTPVQEYLQLYEGISVSDTHVFRPMLDIVRLQETHRVRVKNKVPRIGFYARPSKPRNLYRLGMSALQIACATLDSQQVGYQVYSMGQTHKVPGSGGLRQMKVLGKLTWDSYFGELARTDVLLSLQASPHPSHPPLDQLISGGYSVTNSIGEVNRVFGDRMTATEAQGELLAEAIVGGVETMLSRRNLDFDASPLDVLGLPIETVLADLESEIS